jgi:hypothetical protein
MDYTKYFCPVCKEKFDEESDAVVCPECGTPHHRECWKIQGECANSHLHGSEENLAEACKIKEAEKEDKKISISIENVQVPNENQTITKENVEKVSPSQTFLIDGQPSVLYEIAVAKNQRYYIPHFMAMSRKEGKFFSWNFWACLVPLAWCVYRKMYKLGAIILAIYIALIGFTSYNIMTNEDYVSKSYECFQEDPAYLTNIYLYQAGGETSLTVKQQELIAEMEKIQLPPAFATVSSALLLGIRLVMGFAGNKEYLKTIKKTIKKGEAKGLTGDSLKMFVFRKRGIIPIVIPVLVAIFELLTIY